MQPLYLSYLRLRPMSREAQRDLSDCHNMHRRILMAFPDQAEIERARDHFGALYRVEPSREGVDVLIQSAMAPDWSRLPSGYLRAPANPAKRVDEAYVAIQDGQSLVFRLRANPTKRLSGRGQTHPEAWRGKRVELRAEQDQLAWLERKAGAAGFTLLAVRAASDVVDVRATQTAGRVAGRREGRMVTFGSVVFEGRLRVTDAEMFREALVAGVGSGKAFGFGLLSVAPAMSRD